MGADDSNDSGYGECPGHEWKLDGIDLMPGAVAMWTRCKWCDTFEYIPGVREAEAARKLRGE